MPLATLTRYAKTPRSRIESAILVLVLLLVVAGFAWLLAGCWTTVTPCEVAPPATASFDGNTQNSGIIALQVNGYLVTPHFRDRYNALVGQYGNQFTPPLHTDVGLIGPDGAGDYLIDREHMVQFLEMTAWQRMGRLPK